MAEGFSPAKSILDRSIERRKLSPEIIAKLEEGGSNLQIPSNEVEDGFTRDGYTSQGTTLEDNFDGVSNRLVELQESITTLGSGWECTDGLRLDGTSIQIVGAPSSVSKTVMINKPFTFEVIVNSPNAYESLDVELPYGYTIKERKNWNNYRGGTLVIEGVLNEPGTKKSMIMVTCQNGGKCTCEALKLNHRGVESVKQK